MTATTPPPPAPEEEPRTGQSGTGIWSIVLVFGLIISVFGVSAALGSIHRKQYAEARVAAVYLVRNGNEIGASMQRLEEVNLRDYDLVKQTRAALVAGNMPQFNRLVAQAEINNVEQQRLQQEVRDYQAGFDKVFKVAP